MVSGVMFSSCAAPSHFSAVAPGEKKKNNREGAKKKAWRDPTKKTEERRREHCKEGVKENIGNFSATDNIISTSLALSNDAVARSQQQTLSLASHCSSRRHLIINAHNALCSDAGAGVLCLKRCRLAYSTSLISKHLISSNNAPALSIDIHHRQQCISIACSNGNASCATEDAVGAVEGAGVTLLLIHLSTGGKALTLYSLSSPSTHACLAPAAHLMGINTHAHASFLDVA